MEKATMFFNDGSFRVFTIRKRNLIDFEWTCSKANYIRSLREDVIRIQLCNPFETGFSGEDIQITPFSFENIF